MTKLLFTTRAWDDYLHLQQHDKKLLKQVNALLRDVMRTPFSGKGKPEALRFELQGYWSRRVDKKHRLVYSYDEESDTVTVYQCRYHY